MALCRTCRKPIPCHCHITPVAEIRPGIYEARTPYPANRQPTHRRPTMTEPLTPQQLDEIAARHAAATPGPWGTYESGPVIDIAADLDETGHGYRARRGVCRLEDEPLDNDPTHREWTAEEDWAQVRSDAVFIAHAPGDVAVLLAEIHRLRDQVRFLLGGMARKDTRTGDGGKALREFLAGEEQPPADDFTGTRPCGHDDYHDPHEWADRPDVWCPGHSYADDEPAPVRS